jgi:hypothetical protein
MDETRVTVEGSGAGEPRHYPPGVEFHAPHCREGGNSIAVQVASAITEFPNYQFHICFDPVIAASIARDPKAMAEFAPYVVVEKPDYGSHRYAPSRPGDGTPQPPDAIRPLCRVCRGTHAGEA